MAGEGGGGHMWQGCVCVARRHAWPRGACVGRGCAWPGGHAWWGACIAREIATAAGGMHPTGMHSC